MIMQQTDNTFSTVKISPRLIGQIVEALKNKAYGSVEIYVDNYNVTQITERTINKISKKPSFKTAEKRNFSAENTPIVND